MANIYQFLFPFFSLSQNSAPQLIKPMTSLDARMADVQVCALHTGCLRGGLRLQPNCRLPGQVSLKTKHSLQLHGYELLLWDRY